MDKQKRNTITAAVATVKSEAITSRPVTDLTSALQGNVAGLNFASDAAADGVGGETGAEIKFNIRGVASTIHFMYPLVVALAMMFFFREKKSLWVLFAVLISLLGAALLSLGELAANNGNAMVGLVAACVSVFSYAGNVYPGTAGGRL